MRVHHVFLMALVLVTIGLYGCVGRPSKKPLVIGTTYTAAVSMTMLKFKVLSYKGNGWYTVQLIGSNMVPFNTTRSAVINMRALSILQPASGN